MWAAERSVRIVIFVLVRRELSLAGKSSLTVQFVDGHFVESYYPTIENTFSRVIRYKGQDFATEIVDTAGQVSAQPGVTHPKMACCRLRSSA